MDLEYVRRAFKAQWENDYGPMRWVGGEPEAFINVDQEQIESDWRKWLAATRAALGAVSEAASVKFCGDEEACHVLNWLEDVRESALGGGE